MKKFQKLLHRLLHPGAAVVVLAVLAGAGLLVYSFGFAQEGSPVTYVSYVVSAYALLVVCFHLVPLLGKVNRRVRQNRYVRQYLEDASFQMKVSLYTLLVINLLYAGVNAFSGIYYRSPWFGSLAAYYILLSGMRFSLVRYARHHGFGENKSAQWKRYRLCGLLLTLTNIALAGVVILVIHQNRGFEYAGMLIYIMAAYTFTITVMAIVNLVRYRKYRSPVMSAARVVNLVTALVSMLSLETAMLTQFGSEDSPYFRQVMTSATGGAVCAFVIGMGIYMMVHATRQLKKQQFRNKSLLL